MPVADEPRTAARKNIEPSLKIGSRKSESFFRNAGPMWPAHQAVRGWRANLLIDRRRELFVVVRHIAAQGRRATLCCDLRTRVIHRPMLICATQGRS